MAGFFDPCTTTAKFLILSGRNMFELRTVGRRERVEVGERSNVEKATFERTNV
jgi:hypothetical protein